MNMKKVAAVCLTLALAGGIMSGCSKAEDKADTNASTDTSATVEVKELTMSYITPTDTFDQLTNDEYIIMDVRKAEDYATAHIPGAVSADMDAAKDGDNETGLKNMEDALVAATGSKDAAGKKLVFVCYSGKRYAQAATNIAGALGVDPANMLTLEGGMEAWNAAYEKGTIPNDIQVAEADLEKQFITVDDAKANLGSDDYVFLDVRKAEDYAKGHIEGSLSADLDAAKAGDIQNGAEKLGRALLAATGSVDGAGKNIVLICYTGKSYAQAGTNILAAMDSQMAPAFTLEGGIEAWETAGNPTVQ